MRTELAEAVLFSGSASTLFAEELARSIDLPLGKIHLSRFPDGEISLQLMESVRGREVFVLQTTALDPNNLIMELLVIVDALRRSGAKSITAVIPYFGYCRQDRKDKPRVPITGKLVANILTQVGVSRVLTMDLHALQIQGFFDILVDNLNGRQVLLKAFKEYHPGPCMVVAPDIGSIKLAHSYADCMNADLAIIDKSRRSSTRVEALHLIGDVQGKDVLLADDMCSTAGTLLSAAKACREKGAKRIFAAITHGLFVGDASKKLQDSPIEAVFATDTIPWTTRLEGFNKLHVVSVAPFFGQAILCYLSNESISSLNEK